MKTLPRLLPWLALAAVLCIAWLLWPTGGGKTGGPSGENRRPVSSQRASGEIPDDQSAARAATGPADDIHPSAEVTRQIENGMKRFLASSGEEESKTILEELRTAIRAADPQEAAAAILDFLKSGKDAPTHLPFVVGPEGVMDLVPTLRTALLDLIPSLDPTLALEISRQVMDEMKSPDEYALALRNLAWNDLNGDLKSELSDRLERMMGNKDWSAKPSAGFLEALDAGVEISNKQSFDAIVGLDRQAIAAADSTLARASLIALDRMVLREPTLLVNAFKADPTLHGIAPDQRASLMSRLDVTDPKQREVFVHYLFTTAHGEGELDYFARLFPNGNYVHGNWLITSGEATHTIDSRLAADKATLGELGKLSGTAMDQAGREALQRIRDRLSKIVSDAASR